MKQIKFWNNALLVTKHLETYLLQSQNRIGKALLANSIVLDQFDQCLFDFFRQKLLYCLLGWI